MKIIFLDIDGVLVNRASFRLPRTHGYTPAHPDCVAALNRILLATGANIVVSSVWRMGRLRTELQDILSGWGVDGRVLGKTPHMLAPKEIAGQIVELSAERGAEIQKWMDDNDRYDIASFVILDDDSDMAHLAPRLVRTQFENGLTIDDANRAIEILNQASVATAS